MTQGWEHDTISGGHDTVREHDTIIIIITTKMDLLYPPRESKVFN